MCNCKITCPFLAVIASIIIGIITAFLRITAAITVGDAFLWVVLGIAVVYLAIILVSTSISQCPNVRNNCKCTSLSLVLIAILGTILLSVILLAVDFVATSITGAIITGGLLAFLSLILTSTACLIKCLAKCDS